MWAWVRLWRTYLPIAGPTGNDKVQNTEQCGGVLHKSGSHIKAVPLHLVMEVRDKNLVRILKYNLACGTS